MKIVRTLVRIKVRSTDSPQFPANIQHVPFERLSVNESIKTDQNRLSNRFQTVRC